MKNFYNEIASEYSKISDKRKKYINSVNKIVVKKLKNKKSILDLGSGDGKRLLRISKSLKKSEIVALEPSSEMCKIFKKSCKFKLYQLNARQVSKIKKKFDGIISLWNVFGHIKNNKERIIVLKKIYKKLNKNGIFIVDVNNRHNAKSYGYLKVFIRVIMDAIYFDERRGNTNYSISIGKKKVNASGHLFTKSEFLKNLKMAGFTEIETFTINYLNGELSKSSLNGQLVFLVKKSNE